MSCSMFMYALSSWSGWKRNERCQTTFPCLESSVWCLVGAPRDVPSIPTLQQRRAGWRPCDKSELSPGVDDVSTRYKVRLNRNYSSLRYLIDSEQHDKRIPEPVLSRQVTGTALARFQEVYGSRKILCSWTVRTGMLSTRWRSRWSGSWAARWSVQDVRLG